MKDNFAIPNELIISELGVFNSSNEIFETSPKAVKSIYIPDPYGENAIEIITWGPNNLQPNLIRDQIRKSCVALDCLGFKQDITYGAGIRYGMVDDKDEFIDYTEKGKFKEVDDFFKTNGRLVKYLSETVNNLHWWGFAIPSFIMNRSSKPDERKVLQLIPQDVFFARYVKTYGTAQKSEVVFKDWQNGSSVELDNYFKLKILDQYIPDIDLNRKTGREKTFVDYPSGTRLRFVKEPDNEFGMLLENASTGNPYYPWMNYYSVVESGWLDISNDIPLQKKTKMRNMLQGTYRVLFEKNYWDMKFNKLGLTKKEDQHKFVQKEIDNIKRFLHGLENAGKTMMGEFKYSEDNKELKSVIIEKIERDVEKGEFLEDSHEASSMIYTAFGVNPNLRSGVPGKSSATFSGTDKRELLRIAQTLEKPRKDLILSPLYVIKDFNKWPKELVFSIPDTILTTLDQGQEVQMISNT